MQGLEKQLHEKKEIDQTNRQLESQYVDEEKRRAEVLRIKNEELDKVHCRPHIILHLFNRR